MCKCVISFLFIALCAFCRGDAPLILNFSDHLSAEKLQGIKDQLDKFEGEEILFEIDSRSGELGPSLDLAQQLHDLRAAKGVKIAVYIKNQALGPSAIFPLLADRLLATPTFVWGNIIYGSDLQLPFDQLQRQVEAIIPDNVPNPYLLRLVAQAMIDPKVDVVNEKGWKLVPANPPHSAPLILNRSELANMEFVIESLLPEQFNLAYGGKAAQNLISSVPSVDAELAELIHYKKTGDNLVGYLYIGPDRPIDQTTYLHIKFALEEYKKQNVIFVMLRLNTPGGEVLPAMKIAELLQQFDRENGLPVVAVVYNWALSAGAMLAYSCRFIAVTESALMGAAQPVINKPGGVLEAAPEKIRSALRAEFGSLAKFYGRNPLIAEAMVDPDIVLVIRNGEVVQLQTDKEIQTQGDHPDIVITTQGKLLTLDSQQLLEWGVADIAVPILITRTITPLEKELGEWPAEQSQLFHYPFFANIPNAEMVNYHNWKVDFFAFLTHPIVASLLMLGLIIGIYIELSQPGLGLAGIIAFICLGMILLPNFTLETIGFLEILIIALGVFLILAELFILPGFGFLAAVGTALILFGVFALLLPHFGSVHFSWNWKEWNLATMEYMNELAFYLGALVIALILVALLARYLTPRLLKKSRIVLETEQEGPEPLLLPPINAEGVAFTSLRPGGKILIPPHLYDALSEGGFVERGEKVVVRKIQGNVIIVAKKVE